MTARINRVALIGWRGCGYLELEMDKGTLTGLVGGSGAGKSTIAMCLCFALLPDHRTLNVRPISDVEDSHQAGVDSLSARIDPLVGFGYVVLDVTATNGDRIVAGIHVRVEDGRSHVTRFNLEKPPKERRLQDFLRVVDGDEESYPDFGALRTALAVGGFTLRELRTVNEYGELNRPEFELTPRSWTNLKGFHEEVPNRVQAQGGQELFERGRRSEATGAAVVGA